MTPLVADFSHWDAFDPAALVASGIRAVVLKATQGSNFVDPTFVARVASAKAAGLLVGAYHFADDSDPQAQTKLLLQVAGSLPRLALDLESNGIGNTVTGQTAAIIASNLQSANKQLPLIYTGRYGPSGTGSEYPNSVLSRCPLWLAEYQSVSPQLPSGWATWKLWQYIDMPDDYDYFNGTAEELVTFFSATGGS